MRLSLIVALSLAGCGAGYSVVPNTDAGHRPHRDSGTDGGMRDTGSHRDSAHPVVESGSPDAADDVSIDSGLTDGASNDTGGADTGVQDAGAPDVSVSDTGTQDVGTPDVGSSDTGIADTGKSDRSCDTDAESCPGVCTSFGQDFACDQSEQDCVSSGQLIDSDQERCNWEDDCHRNRGDCDSQCVASCMNCSTNHNCGLSLCDCEAACGLSKP